VIAVEATAVRALETVTDERRHHVPGRLDRLVITPDRTIRSVDGLITGLHEPKASHLMILNGW
jgi:S-adenosylmethionine:tRNA ribosyltransferase-isomerase